MQYRKQPGAEGDHQQRREPPFVPGHLAQQAHGRATTHGAGVHGGHRGADDGRIDPGVGIDEHEAIATRDTRAGIARGCDLSMGDMFDARTGRLGNRGRIVGGGVVDHDDLVRQAQVACRCMQRIERRADQRRFVVGRDDEGKHSGMMARARFMHRPQRVAALCPFVGNPAQQASRAC